MAVNISFAQSYYHAPNDTIIANAVLNDFSVFNIIQIHPTQDTLYFKWQQQSVQMPTEWEAGICDNGECNTYLKDSGMMIPIVPGDNGLMSLHINPHEKPGTAIIRYTIFETHTPQEIDTLTWIISAFGTPTDIKNPELTEKPELTFADGTIICNNLNGNYTSVSVFDMQGRLLIQKKIFGNKARIALPGYSQQILIIRFLGNRTFFQKFYKY